MPGCKKIALSLIMTCIPILTSVSVYADEPLKLGKGQMAPFEGFLLSLELSDKLKKDSEKTGLLEEKLHIDEQMFTIFQNQIKSLEEDRKELNALNIDQNKLAASANKYNGLIYGGFFVAGVLATILVALALKVTVK